MPWMFSKQYIREDRSAEEATRARASVIAHEESYVVFVVRHGESVDNASGDGYSGITDSPLTERGLRQAEDMGRALQKEGIDRIYTSPMKRAVMFARAIQSKTGMLIIDRRLRELNWRLGTNASVGSNAGPNYIQRISKIRSKTVHPIQKTREKQQNVYSAHGQIYFAQCLMKISIELPS